jgi:hypothetical protein
MYSVLAEHEEGLQVVNATPNNTTAASSVVVDFHDVCRDVIDNKPSRKIKIPLRWCVGHVRMLRRRRNQYMKAMQMLSPFSRKIMNGLC